MGRITITRNRHFSGKFDQFKVNVRFDNGVEEKFPIMNGESIPIEIIDVECSISIWYWTAVDLLEPSKA